MMTNLNFSSVKDIEKNINLFDDKIYKAKKALQEHKSAEDLAVDLKALVFGQSKKTIPHSLKLPSKQLGASQLKNDIQSVSLRNQTMDSQMELFLNFLNNKVRINLY